MVVKEKYEKYLTYFDTEHWAGYPNHKRVRVCFVATHKKRLENMMEYLEQLGLPKEDRSRFWFTTQERFSLDEADELLFGRIWETITLPGRLSLFRPRE